MLVSPVLGTLETLGLQDVGVGGPLWPYGRHYGPYGGHCAIMSAIVPLWRPLFPYGDHCALMVTIVPLW